MSGFASTTDLADTMAPMSGSRRRKAVTHAAVEAPGLQPGGADCWAARRKAVSPARP